MLCITIASCGSAHDGGVVSSTENNGVQAGAKQLPTFQTDVPDLHEEMLGLEFWTRRIHSDVRRMEPVEIQAFNQENLSTDQYLHNLEQFPDTMTQADVVALIDQVSRPASSPRYFTDGRQLSDSDYAGLEANVQRPALADEIAVRWGVVVERASMRSYPTDTRVVKHPQDYDLDRFQETGVFPGQRLAILHESADGQWLFAVNYHYAAWLPKRAVAVGERSKINQWYQSSPRLTVTGSQVKTNYNPVDPRTSEVVLDMGVSLPLMSAADVGHNVNGQNPQASYIVALPVRDTEGRLEFEPTLIGRGQDVSPGLLEYRPSLVLEQAFKFLGERYGWGHDYNGRDCTGFVGEVYKSFGILMPRNSGQQGKSDFAPTKRFAPEDHAARAEALAALRVGDLIYIPGHVMMYIGEVEGEPYVIHDVTGLSYYQSDESLYRGTLSGVSITPLSPMRLSKDKSYIDGIYAIKTII
ncbi:SH3 domain-containing protein [Microbulbifer mangrovi]|uniref:SH3 domain-containing protein n=1 Tax=Microbulbifer mangrovi TaxID=927787 RepID=UPI000990499F|nr:SH3 domain-containing protein [Microbulbifer mangrovi]